VFPIAWFETTKEAFHAKVHKHQHIQHISLFETKTCLFTKQDQRALKKKQQRVIINKCFDKQQTHPIISHLSELVGKIIQVCAVLNLLYSSDTCACVFEQTRAFANNRTVIGKHCKLWRLQNH
jgi:hypothetical protein